ncbi:MAG: Ger(x)C family spore germination protein [Bacillota bacterium]
MKNNKFYKLLIVFMSSIFLCGCWDIKDINKRFLPLVMGISKEENEDYKLTLQIPILKDDNQISRTVTSKGENIAGVLEQIRTNSEDAVDYSQIRLIVIQNNLTDNQQRFKALVKFLMKSEEIPSRALIAITDDNVENVLSSINDKLGAHSTSIYDYFNKGAGWAPAIFSTPIWEVYRSLFSYTKDIAVPVVHSGKDTVLTYEGAAIMKKGKIIESISPDESQLINLFRNINEKGSLESIKDANIMVTNSSVKNNKSMENNKPVMSSDLHLKIDILERKEDMTNKQIITELEEVIEKRFYDILEKTQRNNTDVFGFGQHFRHQVPYRELKNWREEYYPELKVNFQVHAKLE